MREIKFRAFDNLKKEMIYKVSVFESCAFKNNVHLPTLNGDRNYFINQFTGLFDKNGVEIYEGDILINPSGDKFKIIYKFAMFVLETKKGVTIGINYPLRAWNIIGNIHENPELLK